MAGDNRKGDCWRAESKREGTCKLLQDPRHLHRQREPESGERQIRSIHNYVVHFPPSMFVCIKHGIQTNGISLSTYTYHSGNVNAPNPKSDKQLQNPRSELLASHGSLKSRSV